MGSSACGRFRWNNDILWIRLVPIGNILMDELMYIERLDFHASSFFGEGQYNDRSAQVIKVDGKWYVELQGGDYEDGKVIPAVSEQQSEDIAEDFCLGFRDH